MQEDNKLGTLERFPIVLSKNTCLTINTFRSFDYLEDSWLGEYNYHSTPKVAAKQLINQIKEECSIRFLWELRQAIAEEIQRINNDRGTNHSLDMPEEMK